MGTGLIILWIVCGIFCLVMYHKIFNVVYFNFGIGCLGELIWGAFGGYLLAVLFMKFWYIGIIVVLFCLFFGKSKQFYNINKPIPVPFGTGYFYFGGIKMFSSNRYMTKGIKEEIPLQIQIYLWNLIDNLPEPKDYLQVFHLSDFEGKQKIIHKQEEPEYSAEYLILCENPITKKIYVIDDETHCTMLLASEY